MPDKVGLTLRLLADWTFKGVTTPSEETAKELCSVMDGALNLLGVDCCSF